MSKSPEQFKQEPYTEDEAQDEAEELKQKVESGEAESYEMAEKKLSLETFEKFLDNLNTFEASKEKIKGAIRDTERGWGKHPEEYYLYNERGIVDPYEFGAGEKIRKSSNKLFQVWGNLYYSTYQFERSLMGLSFNDAMPLIEKYVDNLSDKEKPTNYTKFAISSFLKNQIKPENIKAFLGSKTEQVSDPNLLIEIMNEKFNDA
jgi:hypothetical protein